MGFRAICDKIQTYTVCLAMSKYINSVYFTLNLAKIIFFYTMLWLSNVKNRQTASNATFKGNIERKMESF